jgi:hypothetical protein
MAHYIKHKNLIESLFHEDSFEIIIGYYLSLDPSLDVSKFGLEVNDSGFTWKLRYGNSNNIFLYSLKEICVNPFYIDDGVGLINVTDKLLDMFYDLPSDILVYEREKKLDYLLGDSN